MKQVVLLGKGTLAVRIGSWFADQADFDLVRVVPVVPEPAWSDSLIAWADRRGVPYVDSGHHRHLPELEGEGNLELVFSCFYDKLVKADFIERCDRILNLHNGPLPRYRGVSPINWALKNEEESHGVTIHEITPGIDDGPVVAQSTYSIYPEFDEVEDVLARSLEYGWTLFTQTMPLIDRIEPRQQDDSLATYYSLGDNDRLGDRSNFTRESSRAGGLA